MPALLSEVDVLRRIEGVPVPEELAPVVDAVGAGTSVATLVAEFAGRLSPERVLQLSERAVPEFLERTAPLPLDRARAAQLDQFHLAVIDRGLGDALASGDARRRLRALWSVVPIEVRSAYSIAEVTLSGPDRTVDFACTVLANSLGHRVLECGLPAALMRDPAWNATASFARSWGEGRGVTVADVSDVFLEFDLSRTAEGTARPSLWFRTASLARDGERLRTPTEAIPHTEDAGRRIFDSLGMASVWMRSQARLAECTRRMPENGRCHVDSIGALLAREDNLHDLRVFLACFEPSEVIPYLEAIGWSGDLAPVRARLTDGAQPLQVHLQLTLREGDLVPELSVEFQPRSFGDSFSGGAVVWSQQADQLLRELSRFVDRGWCTPQRFDAVSQWTGGETFSGVLGQRVLRLPNHFKLRLWADGRWLDKMYLGVEYLPPLRALGH